jgi:hypothetical protein
LTYILEISYLSTTSYRTPTPPVLRVAQVPPDSRANKSGTVDKDHPVGEDEEQMHDFDGRVSVSKSTLQNDITPGSSLRNLALVSSRADSVPTGASTLQSQSEEREEGEKGHKTEQEEETGGDGGVSEVDTQVPKNPPIQQQEEFKKKDREEEDVTPLASQEQKGIEAEEPSQKVTKPPTSKDQSKATAKTGRGVNPSTHRTKPSQMVDREDSTFDHINITSEQELQFDAWYNRVCVFGIDHTFVFQLWFFAVTQEIG